jgi:hypothetical protein
MSTILATFTAAVDGTPYDIAVDGSGWFAAEVHGRTYRAATLKNLQADLRAAERKARTEVAVEFVDSATGRRGTARQIHRGTGKVLVTWADGTKGETDGRSPLRPDADVELLAELIEHHRFAQANLEKFRTDRMLRDDTGRPAYSLKRVVEQALLDATRDSAAV